MNLLAERDLYLPPPKADVQTQAHELVRYWRTIKAGRGVSRIEAEEEIDAPLFESLWPLTEGRRVVKDRHAIEDGGRIWEIDRFLGSDLVLAEVELPSASAEAPLPAWLAPHVIREVTGEDAYVNRNLAG